VGLNPSAGGEHRTSKPQRLIKGAAQRAPLANSHAGDAATHVPEEALMTRTGHTTASGAAITSKIGQLPPYPPQPSPRGGGALAWSCPLSSWPRSERPSRNGCACNAGGHAKAGRPRLPPDAARVGPNTSDPQPSKPAGWGTSPISGATAFERESTGEFKAADEARPSGGIVRSPIRRVRLT
jgi:hypothetical protein